VTIIDTLTAEFEKARHFKIEERRKLLKEHPELRIRIDTKLIKQIVNFIEFKCVSDSSIVRNLAIKGSDIDGGLVVSSEILPIEKRLAFVSSLRDQDFSAYDISEYETAERELNDFTEKHHGEYKSKEDLETLHQLVGSKVQAECALIRFFSADEIENFKKNGFPNEGLRKAYYGFSIK
jgi:hypothetical protein